MLLHRSLPPGFAVGMLTLTSFGSPQESDRLEEAGRERAVPSQ
jgi:hypothetical protein